MRATLDDAVLVMNEILKEEDAQDPKTVADLDSDERRILSNVVAKVNRELRKKLEACGTTECDAPGEEGTFYLVPKSPPMPILMDEPEIRPENRGKPQILTGSCYSENVHIAIGFASRCWTGEKGEGTFDTAEAIRLADEMCAYTRLIKEGKAT